MLEKVALDYRPALLSAAGIGRAVRELARALAARGDLELHLFAHSLAAARVAVTVPDSAHFHRLPIPGRSLPLLCRLGLPAERLAGGTRVVHWTDYVQPPTARARVVLTIHDLAFLREPSWHGDDAATLRQRTIAAAARAHAVVVPSTATADDVRRWLPTAPAPRVVPFGSDHVPTAMLPRRRDLPDDYLLMLGTVEPRKNHDALLRALVRLRPPAPLLVVVGRLGWAAPTTVAALRAAVAAGRARWLERLDDAAAFAVLQHARALVYPSLWEGFGFPVLEAMALGVPVVAHDCPPLAELCDGNAALVDARDDLALAAAIDRVRDDDALRRRLVAGGRARAATFRWADCAAAHAAVYREVLG